MEDGVRVTSVVPRSGKRLSRTNERVGTGPQGFGRTARRDPTQLKRSNRRRLEEYELRDAPQGHGGWGAHALEA